MAEVVGLIASCIQIIKLVQESCTFLRDHVHRSSTVKAEAVILLGRLTAYEGLFNAIKLQGEMEDDEASRLKTLSQVGGPLDACQLAIGLIRERTARLPKHVVPGKFLDKPTTAALRCLEDLKPILELALHADQRTITTSINDRVHNIQADIIALSEAQIRTYREVKDIGKVMDRIVVDTKASEERRQCLSWITQTDPRSNYLAARQQLQAKASNGRWLVDSSEFKQWIAGQSLNLLLRGPAGSGKTTLVSSVISALEQRKDGAEINPYIAYFFFDFNDSQKQTIEHMLRSIFSQIAQQNDTFYHRVLALYDKSPTHAWDSRILEIVTQEFFDFVQKPINGKAVYIIIDGLDECIDHEEIGSVFPLQRKGPSFRLLLSGQSIGTPFGPLSPVSVPSKCYIVADMATKFVNLDIESYVTLRLATDPQLRSYSPKMKEIISTTLLQQSNGIFRWASCQLEYLCSFGDRRVPEVKKALRSLPGSLDKTYRRLLDLHNSHDKRMVLHMLYFLAFSARPITIHELAEFAVIENDGSFSLEESRFNSLTDVRKLCGSFVIVQDSQISLSHKSVREFLIKDGPESIFKTSAANLHRSIERRCLTYLSLEYTSGTTLGTFTGPRSTESPLANFLQQYPFIDYACHNWAYHLAAAEKSTIAPTDFSTCFSSHGKKVTIWEKWLSLQRADIWDNQIALAITTCEAIYRGSSVPAWTKGFWAWRREQRTTSVPLEFEPNIIRTTGLGFEESPENLNLKLVDFGQYALILESISRNAGELPLGYYIAVLLIEIATQQPLCFMVRANCHFSQHEGLELITQHLKLLFEVLPAVQHRMGTSYANIIRECLAGTEETPSLIYSIAQPKNPIDNLRVIQAWGFRYALGFRYAMRTEPAAESGMKWTSLFALGNRCKLSRGTGDGH